jgi:hypothetical protein
MKISTRRGTSTSLFFFLVAIGSLSRIGTTSFTNPDEAPPGPSGGSLEPRDDPRSCGRRLVGVGGRREAEGLRNGEERKAAAAAA